MIGHVLRIYVLKDNYTAAFATGGASIIHLPTQYYC